MLHVASCRMEVVVAVVGEAVALLDEAGEQALTFRALAARLGGGVGSIYWYVASTDELLDPAAAHVLAGVLEATAQQDGDPLELMRELAGALFDAVAPRPWLSSYFMRDTETQPNALRIFDRMGRSAMRLDLTPRQALDAVGAIIGFVIGTAADVRTDPVGDDGEPLPRDAAIEQHVGAWQALDADEFPFLHHVLGEFAAHEDRAQFEAGLDLVLAGVRQQAGPAAAG